MPTQSVEEKLATLYTMFAVAPDLGRLHALKERFRTLCNTAAACEKAGQQSQEWIGEVQASEMTKRRGLVAVLACPFATYHDCILT